MSFVLTFTHKIDPFSSFSITFLHIVYTGNKREQSKGQFFHCLIRKTQLLKVEYSFIKARKGKTDGNNIPERAIALSLH